MLFIQFQLIETYCISNLVLFHSVLDSMVILSVPIYLQVISNVNTFIHLRLNCFTHLILHYCHCNLVVIYIFLILGLA